MDLWVITDPAVTELYGTVEALNEPHAAARVDAGQATWFGQTGPGPHEQLNMVAADTLADGRWRQVAPTDVARYDNHVGGGVQVGFGFSKRFAQALPGRRWAVQDVTFYLACQPGDDVNDPQGPLRIERHDDYTVCTDLHDIGSTEQFNEMRYTEISPAPSDVAAGDRLARKAAESITADNVSWTGEEFYGYEVPQR